jgi:plastocyanin
MAAFATACAACALLAAAPAGAAKKSAVSVGQADGILGTVTYPDTTTFSCRTDAIPISPGQNLNLFATTKTCPNAQKLSGPGSASTFAPGSTAEGYVTRFRPSMVEIKPSGLVTPSVWDLHLHHVVWLAPGAGPTFASGEEKTIVKLPEGYGFEATADETWGLNYMIHSLNASSGRQVYITWEIDWVPINSPSAAAIDPVNIKWLDVAGSPQLYPVFDAQQSFDTDGDGEFVFPDDVPNDPAAPAFEEQGKISNARRWTVPGGGRTLVFGAGHLHPGGLHVDLEVARDGSDPGSTDGDTPSEVRQLFRSDARYYEPAGAVSWDVAMKATRPGWRVSLEGGDTVSVNTTYDVEHASWYESMGILPLAVSAADDPAARDPFDDAAEAGAMYDRGGILTHGRLRENIDAKANRKLGLPKPKKLRGAGTLPDNEVEIDGFLYSDGGFSAIRGFPEDLMRPPTISAGESVTFTNLDALPTMSQTDQAWHSITPCPAPCNRGSGIGYPLARGPVEFDSGQLGFGTGTSAEVTTGSNTYTTPAFSDPGTYTYFCRIHPFMRGSIRVK